MTFEIVNQSGMRIPGSLLARDIRRVRSLVGKKKLPLVITVVCLRPQESRRIKKRYLKKDKPANVLSFNYGSHAEIILCPALIKAEGAIEGIGYHPALRRMLVHGLTHITGYDHEARNSDVRSFEAREERILQKLGIRYQS